MPEGDAQKKEAERAKPLENLTLDEDATNVADAGTSATSPSTDAQKK